MSTAQRTQHRSNVAALQAAGAERDLDVSAITAGQLLAEHHLTAAIELVEAAAALSVLASAVGQDLDADAGLKLLERTRGDYDRAAERLIKPVRERRQRLYEQAYSAIEDKFYAEDAKARHAVFVGHIDSGRLGYQAGMLLQAARDAGLAKPDHLAYRKQLDRIVQAAIATRYPIRRETEWQVASDPAHFERVKATIRDEQHARQLVLDRRPELAQRIDAISSSKQAKDVLRILNKIRSRLASRAEQGWMADPKRYHQEVVEAAAALSIDIFGVPVLEHRAAS